MTALGYVPGTSAYEALFCGSWVGPNERCDDFYGVLFANPAWGEILRAPVGGRWYDSPLDFAAAVQANTILARANPAKSYNDIAPVPLPTSLLFLGSGVLVLLRIGQRRMSHA